MENLKLMTTSKSYSCNEFDYKDFLDMNDSKRSSNPIFKAFGYPSKIYYPNIQKFIKAYTKEGATILDSFCGSGSTGIAAKLENRNAILIDNSPQAINITQNTFLEVNIDEVEKIYKKLKSDLKDLINKLYYAKTSDGYDGYAESIITTNTYACPSCNNEIVLHNTATGKRSEYQCSNCGYLLNISKEEDKKGILKRRIPVEVHIRIEDKNRKLKTEKRKVTDEDLIYWTNIENEYEKQYGSLWSPKTPIVYNRSYPRTGGWPGFPIDSTVDDLFPKKNLLALKILNSYIEEKIVNQKVQQFFKFVFTEILFRVSKRLFVTSGIKTVYHIPPVGKEQNVLTVFDRKFKSIVKAKIYLNQEISKNNAQGEIKIIKSNARDLPLPDNSIDYAFIDPPYGGVVPYAELNLFYSAWLRQKEDLENEVIIPMDYEKKPEYVSLWGNMIEQAFSEVFRVLKPGSYFTIVFQSKFNSIWNELRDVMVNRIGFEFENIVGNERAETFHTNHLNDTNPQSAFITYKKPLGSKKELKEKIKIENILNYFGDTYLNQERTFREIQSYVINLVHENNFEKVPSDVELEKLLIGYRKENGMYRK